MCGIIGICLSDRNVFKIGELLFKALLRLEYRGYDSAGIAVIDGNKLIIAKGRGKLRELEEKHQFTKFNGITGIGHTRWATHGAPSDINAHPHVDCRGIFSIVHNGIIENYIELRNYLIEKGHVFKSETDTETAVHLIEEFYFDIGDVYTAFKEAIKLLKGTYAILLVTPLEPGKIFFAKKDSPLIAGLGNGLNFIASDIPALLDHTRRVIVVRDYWVGYITASGVFIEDIFTGNKINYEDYIRVIEWSLEDASKEGYNHFMVKEIYEQPRALIQTTMGLRSDSSLDKTILTLLNTDRIFITGAGTSYHASEFFALSLMKLGCKSVIPFIASEYEIYAKIANENDVLIAVSQSGETIDVLKAVRAFKKNNVRVIALSNVVESAIPRESDLVIYTRAGPEIGVAATKTFLTQALALSWITVEYSHKGGRIDSNERRELLRSLEDAGKLVELSIRSSEYFIEKLSIDLVRTKSMYYLSRDIGIPVAKEGALKIKEIAYVHAEAYPAGESKHGPIALLEQGFPVLFIIPNDPVVEQKILGNIEEMKARDAFTIGVFYKGSHLKDMVEKAIEVPASHWITTPITHTPPLQLLAYYLAIRKGYDPDKPRNLAKTVTVE